MSPCSLFYYQLFRTIQDKYKWSTQANLSYTHRKIFPNSLLRDTATSHVPLQLLPGTMKLFDIQATKLLPAYLWKSNDTQSFLLSCLSNFAVNVIVPLNPKTYVLMLYYIFNVSPQLWQGMST